jgi:hypothetical protein
MKAILLLAIALVSVAQQPSKKPAEKPHESFWEWLARVTGISATSSGLKGELATSFSGDIWIARIDDAGGQRLTFEGKYSWPVFSQNDQSIIAIREGALWSVPVGGGDPVKLRRSPPDVSELVGAGPQGIVLYAGDRIGLFDPESGDFAPFSPKTDADGAAIERLRAPMRTYVESTVAQQRNAVTIDIHGDTHSIEKEGERMGEPSLSHDQKWIVYVRAPAIEN